jgi:hypothetical protein
MGGQLKQGNKWFLIGILILAAMWLGYFLRSSHLLSPSCVKGQNTLPESAATPPSSHSGKQPC